MNDTERNMIVPHVCTLGCQLPPTYHFPAKSISVSDPRLRDPKPYDIREEAKKGNINAYGDYTIENWFSAGEGDPYDETFDNQGTGRSFQCMAFGLAGEVGEIMEKLKKIVRDGTYEPEALKKEFGDAQFYLVRLMRYFGWEPSEVLGTNIDKLDDRRARGVMRGSGDNR